MSEMQVVAEIVLSLMDKIVQMDDDGPVLSLVAEMRDCLDGATPSMILQRVVLDTPNTACELQHLQDKYDELAAKLAPKPKLDEKGDGYYTIEEFMAALQIKMGRTYGWRVDYVAASAKAGCIEAKNENFQKWQRTKKVPAWAYEQIDRLSFDKRPGKGGPLWTTQDIDYLVSLYIANPNASNIEFASQCTQHFGRPITESAIRGALDRLRKKGRIDKVPPEMNDAGTQLNGEIRLGDCLDLIEKQDNIYDAIVTDPPFETSYQGKLWDSTYISFSSGLWARLFQVLKPGGFLTAFAAGRLYHRMATAAERAGFIIYPILNWKFDGGLPKPINVSELFDRRKKTVLSDNQAEAFEIALKQPYRWVLVSPKTAAPMIARDWIRITNDCPTVTANGRLIYDAYKVSVNSPERPVIGYRVGSGYTRANVDQGLQNRTRITFPIYARHVSQEAQEWRGHYYGVNAMKPCMQPILMAQKPSDGPMLDNIRKYRTGALNLGALEQRLGSWPTTILEHPRARRSEHQSDHVSVKPVALMEDLCALVCPSGGRILDPFAGTGTTGVAARNQGFNFVLIEQNADMHAVIQRRLLSQDDESFMQDD